MTKQEILNLNLRNGCNYLMHTHTTPRVRVQWNGRIEKDTFSVVRLGVEYANLKCNQEKETGSLPYGEWEEAKWLIKHNDETYLRCTANSLGIQSKSIYYLDGEEIDYEQLVEMGVFLKKSDTPSQVFNYNIKNIISIGKQ